MSIVETVKGIQNKLKAATTTIVDEIASLRGEIAAKRANIETLETQLVSRKDLSGRIRAYVREVAEYGAQEYRGALLASERGLASPDLKGRGALPWTPNDPAPWWFLCLADPETAVKLLERAYAGLGYEGGPPLAERPALLAQLKGDLAKLESAEERLVDDAAASGVTIAHRPDVVVRRSNEDEARRREEKELKARRERQDAMNCRHAERKTVRSRYIG